MLRSPRVVNDIRLALRRLGATPLFTVFAILSLAIGVAITTAVYSIVDTVLLRGLGVREPGRVAIVATPYSGRLLAGTVSAPDFHDLRAAQTSFSHMAASATLIRRVALPSATQMLMGEAVSGSYFATLGVSAARGRAIQPADDDGAARVVMLSDALWRRTFASDPRVVGTVVTISSQRYEVIGVAPPTFTGPRGWLASTQFWIPLGSQSDGGRESRRLTIFGRLASTVTIAAASSEVRTIAARLDQSFPPRYPGKSPTATDRPWRAKTMAEIADEDTAVRRFGMTLVALVGLVLVVACTNLGNLVLARGTTRLREIAVRRALGASRWRLVREQCLESVILAAGGAVASYVVFELLRAAIDTEISLAMPFGGRTTLSFHPVLNVTALGVAVSSLLVALVVFGLEPAIQLTRTIDVRGALAAGSTPGPPRRRRQRALLRWQVAIAAGFFIIATMFVKYSIAEARHDSGVDLDRIGVAVLNLDGPEWSEARARRTLDRLLGELRGHPSIESASLTGGLPFGVSSALRVLDGAGGTGRRGGHAAAHGHRGRRDAVDLPDARSRDPSRTRLRRSRRAGRAARPHRQRVHFAADFWNRRRRRTAGRARRPAGRARDGHHRRHRGEHGRGQPLRGSAAARLRAVRAGTYQPLVTVVTRASGSVPTAVGAMREAIRRADPDVAIDRIGTGRTVLAGPFQVMRGFGLTAIGLGAITLLLAMAGLYGIQSHVIANRTREIGVRMSFGATSSQIKRMVLVDGYRPVLDGLLFGLSIGLVGRAIARAYLELDVAIVDPWMLVVTPIPLVGAAFFACYLPARRAAAVDPNVALRCE